MGGPSRDAKSNMTKHFKKLHVKENQLERKVECPRCPEEVPKSGLNPHMDQKHGIKNFKQLAKRSFQPGVDASKNSAHKKPKMTLDSDDTNPISQDLNNNKTKTKPKPKQAGVKKGSKKNSKQEPDTSEYSADEMLKMMLDNEGVDPLTQTLSDIKTKTKPGVKKGSKKNIKQEPDTSDNSSNEMPKMTLDGDPLALDLNENKIKTEKDLKKNIKQE